MSVNVSIIGGVAAKEIITGIIEVAKPIIMAHPVAALIVSGVVVTTCYLGKKYFESKSNTNSNNKSDNNGNNNMGLGNNNAKIRSN